MSGLQVEKEHYNFDTYMTQRRWASIWCQLSCISKMGSNKVLEIGPGAGVLKAVGRLHGLEITTVDIDPMLQADYVGSVNKLPFDDEAFELVCAFQVLEHLEFETAINSLSEIKRVTSRYALISLPNAQIVWRYRIYLPKIGEQNFMFVRPFWRPEDHIFDGEHYWEINKKGYEIDFILFELSKVFSVQKHWRNVENPYHHFFLLEKKK